MFTPGLESIEYAESNADLSEMGIAPHIDFIYTGGMGFALLKDCIIKAD